MKKIYAAEINPEHFDSEAYYPELTAVDDNVSILGNQRLCGVNIPMVEDIQTALDNSVAAFEDPDVSEEDKNAAIHYEFGYLMQGEPTEDQLRRIYRSVEGYTKDNRLSESEEICDLLEIVHGEPFVRRTIRGCCQDDWNYCYLPVSKLDSLSYIEAVYFGTGAEFAIAALDDMEGKGAEEIADEIVGSPDCHYLYTELSDAAEIKERVAESEGADSKDVVLIRISGMHTVTVCDYEIA